MSDQPSPLVLRGVERSFVQGARGYALRPRPPQEKGANVLIVGRDLSADTVKSTYAGDFETIEELPPVAIKQAGAAAFHVALYLGRGFRGQAQDGARYK